MASSRSPRLLRREEWMTPESTRCGCASPLMSAQPRLAIPGSIPRVRSSTGGEIGHQLLGELEIGFDLAHVVEFFQGVDEL